MSVSVNGTSMWIGRGAHPDSGGRCVMEWVSLLAGEDKTDRPRCTNALVATAAIEVNDLLDDTERQRLGELVPRLLLATRTGDRVDLRLAVWCGRTVQPLVHPALVPAAADALDAAESWLAGHGSEHACRAAALATADGAARHDDRWAFAAANVASGAADAAAGVGPVNLDGVVATALRAALRRGADPVAWLADLIDAHGDAAVAEAPAVEFRRPLVGAFEGLAPVPGA